jgi:hypothetical protein
VTLTFDHESSIDEMSCLKYLKDWTSVVAGNPTDYNTVLSQDVKIVSFKKDSQPIKNHVKAKYVALGNIYAKRRYRRNRKLLRSIHEIKQSYPLSMGAKAEKNLNEPSPLTFTFSYDKLVPANQMEGK